MNHDEQIRKSISDYIDAHSFRLIDCICCGIHKKDLIMKLRQDSYQDTWHQAKNVCNACHMVIVVETISCRLANRHIKLFE